MIIPFRHAEAVLKLLFPALLTAVAMIMAVSPVNGRTWKANYRPSGRVIAMQLNGITAYTDAHAMLKELTQPAFCHADSVLAALVRGKQRLQRADTLRLACWELHGFEEDIEADNPTRPEASDMCNYWMTDDVLIRLADANKLALYDDVSKRRITNLTTKNIGSIDSGHRETAYIDQVTGKELFYRVLYWQVSGNPKF